MVWVANRECPLNDPSSKALEFKDGNLFITEKGNPFCNCTNSSMPNPTVAVLLDNGNFILRDNLDNVLWQSFEEQTNTWLPGAKIRYNRHTNRSNILVSWRNYESPDSGQYYVELKVEENGTAYLVLYNGKTRIVSNRELNNPYINASYVSNNNEGYFLTK